MPARKITSRMTNRAENTRPRSSRGVCRWSSVWRATAEGELKKPLTVTQTMPIRIVGDRPYRIPAMPMPMYPTKTHRPIWSRSAYLAMNRLPSTNPIEVRPSWIPYSNSEPPRTVMAIGSSRTFHRPKAKNTGAPSRNSERSIGVSRIVRTPVLRLLTTRLTEASSSGASIFTRVFMK